MAISAPRVAAFALLTILAAACSGGGTTPPAAPSPGHAQSAPLAIGERPPLATVTVPQRLPIVDTVPPPPPTGKTIAGKRTISAHASFFNGEVPLSNGVYYLSFPNANIFGYYSYIPNAPNYIYHFDLGYEYVFDAGNGAVYFYDFASGHWWYTSQTFSFPYVWDFTVASQFSNGTLFYYISNVAGRYTANPRYFYEFGDGEIVTLPTGAAPTAGYLSGGSGGGLAGVINSTTTAPTIVGVSTAHVQGASGTTVPSGTFVINSGVGISSVARRVPQVVQRGFTPPADGPLDTELYHRIRAALPRAPAGTPPTSYRRTKSLGTTVGSQNPFWVNGFAIGTNQSFYTQEPATLQAVTSHGYIWVANSLGLTSVNFTAFANAFENAWMSDTSHFGTPLYTTSSPGAGGNYYICDSSGNILSGSGPAVVAPTDSKINVLVVNPTDLGSGVGGYFSAVNYIPQEELNCFLNPKFGGGQFNSTNLPRSNEAPMIYVGYFSTNPIQYEDGEDSVRGTAHEFQHLINFINHDVLHTSQNGEDRWINEGMSMLAQDLAVRQMYPGASNDVDDALSHASQYLAAPENVSIPAFTQSVAGVQTFNCSACYGGEYLFQRYLYDRFGGDTYLKSMLATGTTSYQNLQNATGVSPDVLLSDFAIALAASNTGTTTDARFNFTGLNLHASYSDPLGLYQGLTLSGPATLTFAPGSYTQLQGSFLYLQGSSSLHGQTVTVKSPTSGFALNAGIVQR